MRLTRGTVLCSVSKTLYPLLSLIRIRKCLDMTENVDRDVKRQFENGCYLAVKIVFEILKKAQGRIFE